MNKLFSFYACVSRTPLVRDLRCIVIDKLCSVLSILCFNMICMYSPTCIKQAPKG